MLFKSIIDSPSGIRYMLDTLNIQSSCARKLLLESEMMVEREALEKAFAQLRWSYDKLFGGSGNINGFSVSTILIHIQDKLQMVRDIYATLQRLSAGAVLDDIELFEIKYLSFLSRDIRERVEKIEFTVVEIPNLDEVIQILDPDGLNIRTFYVYDSYSEELAQIRSQIKLGEEHLGSAKFGELMEKAADIEFEVRERLCRQLSVMAERLKLTLRSLSELDILIAKLLQIKALNLIIPEISDNGVTSYKGMFHPQVKEALCEANKKFTPIDLEFGIEPVTIIGANMGGKTVVLKMLAMNQLLFQFGFGVAAESAVIDIKDEVFFCIGDDQNIVTGLSSFAAEMKQIDAVLTYLLEGDLERGNNGRILALVDEPARTTNPVEGRALAESLVDVLSGRQISALLTTHYNIDCEHIKKMRVVGLVDGVMDYRLVKAESGDIPHEAINIAKSLNINKCWIEMAERRLEANGN